MKYERGSQIEPFPQKKLPSKSPALLRLSVQINMVMKKIPGQLKAGMFANIEESVRHLVSNDQGFLFMNQIKATSAYWKKFQETF